MGVLILLEYDQLTQFISQVADFFLQPWVSEVTESDNIILPLSYFR